MSALSDVPYPTAIEKFPTVRQSLLATFDTCALASRFSLDHEQGWNTHVQGRGIIFHRFAAKALLAMVASNERLIPQDLALEILRECLRQHDVEPRDQVPIPFSEIKDLRWMVVKFATDNEFDIELLASVEERLEATVEYDRGDGFGVERRITGQLDALFFPEPSHAIVLDWKTGWALPPPKELSEDGYFQQRIYGFLVLRRYPGVDAVTLREHYVRHHPGATVGTGNVREATLTRAQLPDVEEEIAALVERFDRAVEHGNWPPKKDEETGETEKLVLWTPSPGKHCSYCPRPGACPIFPDARVEGAITSPEMAERFAAEAAVAKAALDQRMKAMKAWGDVRGEIPVKDAKDPNRVWGYKSHMRKERPTRETLEAAIAVHGPKVNLDELYVERPATRFTQHSSPGVPEEPGDSSLMEALEESVKQMESGKSPPKDTKPPDEDRFGDVPF